MKNFALLALLVALPLLAVNVPYPLVSSKRPAASGACATTDTTNSWDNYLEGFQIGSFSNLTLVGTVANITTNADSSSLTSGKPPGVCDSSLQIVIPTDGTETYAQFDLGAAIDLNTIQTDVYVSFYFTDLPSLTGEAFRIFGGGLSAGSPVWHLEIRNISGTVYIVGVSGVNAVNSNTVTTGTWYSAKIGLDTAAAANGTTLQIWNAGTELINTTMQRTDADLRYINFGPASGLAADENGTIYWDAVSIKTN